MSGKNKNALLTPAVFTAIFGFLGVVIAASITAYFSYKGSIKPLEMAATQTQETLRATSVTTSPPAPPRDWYVIFSHEFPAGYWNEGIHKYLFKADCPFSINSTKANEPPYSFSVRQGAELQDSMVYIRRGGLFLVEISGISFDDKINPSQATTAIYGPLALTFEDAKRLRDECKVRISIDDGEFTDLNPIRIDKITH